MPPGLVAARAGEGKRQLQAKRLCCTTLSPGSRRTVVFTLLHLVAIFFLTVCWLTDGLSHYLLVILLHSFWFVDFFLNEGVNERHYCILRGEARDVNHRWLSCPWCMYSLCRHLVNLFSS